MKKITKKTLSVLLAALIAMSSVWMGLGVVGFAANKTAIKKGSWGTNITYTLYNDGSLEFKGSGDMKDGVIYYGNIFACSGDYNTGKLVKSISISSGITSIGVDVFSWLENLEEVKIPGSVTKIGDHAFAGCKSLKSITIPDSVTSIGEWSFEASGLESITIPSSVTSLGHCAFFSCESLNSVVFSDGIKSIGKSAFSSCCNITNVTIPASVTKIGVGAFNECRTVANVNYNGTKAQWEKISIAGNNIGLYTATIFCSDGDIEGVGTGAYTYHYIGEWGNNIKYTLRSWGDLVFEGEGAMKDGKSTSDGYIDFLAGLGDGTRLSWTVNIQIFPGITSIGKGMFNSFYNVRSVIIPDSVTSIGDWAFYSCNSLKDVYYSGTEEQWNEISIGANNDKLIKANIHYNTYTKGIAKPQIVNTVQNTNSIKLIWYNVNGADVYRVYQKTSDGWKNLGNVTRKTSSEYSDITNATIKNLSPGTKYTFAVMAGRKSGDSIEWSDVYSTIKIATKAEKIATVNVAQSTSAIKLTWDAVVGATGYRVYQKIDGKWKTLVSTISETSYIISGLKAGTKYTFAVKPYIKTDSGVIWSSYTELTTATKPSTVTAKADSSSKGKITLTWNNVSGDIDGYRIYYKVGNGAYKIYKNYGSVKNLTFSNLKSGTKYTFAVRAGIKTSGGIVWSGYKTATVTVK